MIEGSNGWGVKDANGNNLTVLGTEVASLTDIINSVTQVSVPASGSNTTQFSFFNTSGAAIASPRLIEAYLSDINGLPVTAIASWAAATNGAIDPITTGKIHNCITTATGLLGILFTGTAATRYCTFVLPNGKLIISGPIVIN